jgi:flagellar hook-associated protein FlgK
MVQGAKACIVSVSADAQDASLSRLQLQKGSTSYTLDDQLLAGGKIKGLLAFEQNDLSLAKNLCGRLAMTVGLSVNKQHTLGLDIEGNLGKDMFSIPTQVDGLSVNGPKGKVTFSLPTDFVASNYVVQIDAAGTGWNVIRQIDGKTTSFLNTTAATLANQNIDGLKFVLTSTSLSGGESILFKPFADASGNIKSELTSPLNVAASADTNTTPSTSPLNSANAKELLDLRDKKLIDGGRLTDAYATAVAQIGLRVQSVQFSLDASQSIAVSMSEQKARVSSVNLDEEAARLMQFQQAYQASAKILQIAQRVMDTMLQELGR